MANKKKISGRFAYATDIGRTRISNEDQALALTNAYGDILLMVCDGMGGQNKGEYASHLAIKTIADAFESHSKFHTYLQLFVWLNRVISSANKSIFNESENNVTYHGMGTTLSLVVIHKNRIYNATVGDSRTYFLEDGKLVQMSEDQTYVGYLYRTGQIKKEEMLTHPKRHVLMNALGTFPNPDIDIKVYQFNHQSILVCTDGIYNNVSEITLQNVLNNHDTPDQKITEIISIGNNNGGSDNMGLVIWEENVCR